MEKYKLKETLKYNKDFSWVLVKGDIATLGIIEPASKKAKEFVFVMLPKVGDKIKKEETYASIEAVKWTGHLSSPLTGEISEVNEEVYDEPSLLNEDPYGNWIVKMRLSNPKELDELLTAKEAEKWLKSKIEN